MNKILFIITFLASTSLFAATYPANYNCVDHEGYKEDIVLTIYDADEYLVNGVDRARIDSSYNPKNPRSTYKRLDGYFGSVGDGVEGYTVNLLINKYIYQTAKFGYMIYQASGPNGYYSVSFKCTKFYPGD